jgi:hypothetical protein
MVNEVMSGGSYYSQNSLTLHFGLGTAISAESIDVRWPNGGTQKLGQTAADQTVHIVEQTQ